MFRSLMPKGVEHNKIHAALIALGLMFHSLMPKGVEHRAELSAMTRYYRMFHSLMPKGVEHYKFVGPIVDETANVSFVDAERR